MYRIFSKQNTRPNYIKYIGFYIEMNYKTIGHIWM